MDIGRDNSIGLAAICLLGVLPLALRLLGMPANLPIAILVFIANLAVCAWMIGKGQMRWLWSIYALACVASLILVGMTSPIALLLFGVVWRT
jgi:hypothetical protein